MHFSRNITALPRALGIAALVAAAAVLSGCWDDADGPAATPPVVPGATVPAFTVEAPAGSAIAGAKVEVPADAVTQADNITITHEDALPLAVNAEVTAAGYEALSKTLVIQRTGAADFGKTVDVTIPYDKTKLPAHATPIVVYFDEDTGSYSPIAVNSIDRANGLVVFGTAHASKYAVIWIRIGGGGSTLDPATLTTSVNFDPAVDGFFVHNFGSYEEPGGNSFGMAGYAAWYHHAKKALKGAGLRTLYQEGNPVLEEDDQTARELILRAYQAGDQKAHIKALNNAAKQGATNVAAENAVALSLIQQLIMTKQAQLLVMGKGLENAWTDGQAVAVYAYDGTNQRFQYYDPRFPGEVVTLPWNPTTGFGVDSKNKEYDVFAFASFNSAYSSKTLTSLYQAAEAGFPSSQYPKVVITSPAEVTTQPGTFEIAEDGVVVIKGSVPRPANADNPTAQRYAHVYLNGSKLPDAYPLDQSSNTFEVTLAKLPTVAGTDVMVLVSETEKSYAGWGSGAAWAGGFHAFKQFRVRVANQFFFQNVGFELGDFTGWVSERHTWSAPTPQLIPSDKSAIIATPGFDPIATDLQVPLFGTKAARVNNRDNNEHISTLTQSAVVPTGKNPVLRFYWSAVLEDPQHSPQDQPYIEIVVVNKTKSLDLYRKRFFSNDPLYSGWLSYQNGSWKSIPWQLVELPVGQYAGDTIELKIEAADCALGGHGGYGYLDVDE